MLYKHSKQRDIILNYMRDKKGHVRAEQIFDDLKRDEQNISLATVYRNLNILSAMNEIKKIVHPEFGYVYDHSITPHYHLYCTQCNELYDIPVEYQACLDKEVSEELGVEIESHMITFHGVCKSCQEIKKQRS